MRLRYLTSSKEMNGFKCIEHRAITKDDTFYYYYSFYYSDT